MMSIWQKLETELDRWKEEGRVATFWWRDDDATAAGPKLDRLHGLALHFDIPLHLAVIPETLQPSLVDAVPDCSILQHGVRHENRAGKQEKKSEFPEDFPDEEVLEKIQLGHQQLRQNFAAQFLPVMVPPWNRISRGYIEELPTLGFRGISCYKARQDELALTGIGQVNTHIDPIAWKEDRGYVGDDIFVQSCLDHLQDRRQGKADILEPTGLLTHHRDHDEDIWAAIFSLLDLTSRHEAVRWITLQAAFSLIEELPDGLENPFDDEDISENDLNEWKL